MVKAIRFCAAAAALTLAASLFMACASTDTESEEQAGTREAASSRAGKPEYVIKAKRDVGFVSAYQAYFAVDGTIISKITASRFDDLTLGDNSLYAVTATETYAFDVQAKGTNPALWTYEQNEYDAQPYDLKLLRSDLKRMQLSYTGTLYVLITVFDDYRIVQVANLDGNVLIDDSYALFKDDIQLTIPRDSKLCDIWRVYKRK